jgi:CO/xanthine dehydrogenase Mo-binding subunit
MSTNHRAEAEMHLANAARHLTEDVRDMRIAEVSAWIGQGHAALAANTVNDDLRTANDDLRTANDELRIRLHSMRRWVSGHIAHGLASNNHARWKAARDLAQGLDSADVNIDELVDEHLADDGYDKTAWDGPSSTARARDPWAATSDITAEVPGPVRRVLADYLAAALLSKGDAQGVGQTITFALKHAGADLTGDIEKRISELTLGRDPSDPPF